MDEDDERFRSHAVRFWERVGGADSTAAHAETDALDALVAKRQTRGDAEPFLRTFLRSEDERVRYAAAAYLAREGDQDGMEVLRHLAESSSGLVAPSARLLLMRHQG